MNRSVRNQSSREPLRMPGQLPNVSSSPTRPTGRPYPIRPTPTFSFTEELESARRRTQPPSVKTRSGGGVLLFVLMLLAGSAGYVAVKYRVWQDTAPLVQRAKELAQSLRTLAPTASPEPPRPPSPRAAPAAAAPSAPRLAPEVVPITRAPEPATAQAATSAHDPSGARHQSTPAHRHRSGSSGSPARKVSADSGPSEDELLAPPANRR
jgi:hypothetical protein